MAFHVFNHHNGIIDYQSRGQRDAKQGERIDGEAEKLGEDKRSHKRNRNGDGRNNRAAPSLQEKENHDDHDQDGFRKRLEHLADRFAHRARCVKCYLVFQAGGEALCQPLHLCLHVAPHLQGVGIGELQHAQPHGVLAVIAKLAAIAFRTQLGAAHVAQFNQRAIAGALDHNVLKLFGVAQPSHGANADLVTLAGLRRRLAHLSGSHLNVLLAQRGGHVSGSKSARRQPHRIKPQPHGILALAKDDYITHALHALDGVAHIEVKVIADEKVVVFLVGRVETVRHHKRAGIFGDAYACRLHFNRQAPQRAGCPVLYVDRGHIQVAVQFKSSVDGSRAVIATGGTHIAHAFRAIDGLLQQRGHTGFHRLRVCSGIEGGNTHRRRREVGILRHRQRWDGHGSCQHNQQRANGCENGPANEKIDHEESLDLLPRINADQRG